MKPPKSASMNAKEKLTADWLKRASGDLRVAKQVVAMGPQFFVFVLFHAQQTAEKSLKAFLVWNEIPFKYVHDIATLADLCLGKDPSLAEIAKEADSLTKYAVNSRYPGEDHDPDAQETKHGLKVAEKVFTEVLERIPKGIHPKKAIKKKRTSLKRSKGR